MGEEAADELAERRRLREAIAFGSRMLQLFGVQPDWCSVEGQVYRLGPDGKYHPTDEDMP